jgi:BirA family biotin operon repressor/biotin-[acetyl-CoA-carboxylase] ligase
LHAKLIIYFQYVSILTSLFSQAPIIRLTEVNSTNVFARNLLNTDKNIREGTLIIAQKQTEGKGQAGNTWESEENKNIILSIILFPNFIELNNIFSLNMAISLAVNDCLSYIIKEHKFILRQSCLVKWPNDIYFGNNKLSGILIENTFLGNILKNSIIGIGINVNQEKFSKNIPNPSSLKIITGKEISLEYLLTKLQDNINQRYSQLRNNEYKKLKEDYINRLYLYNKSAKYIYRDIEIQARIIDVLSSGKLILLNEFTNSVIECYFQEIKFKFL